MTAPLLNAKEAAKALNVSRATFDRHLRRGRYRNLVNLHAPGQRRFIVSAIEQFNAGQSLTRLVHRRSA